MKLELFIFDIFPFVPLNAFSVLSVPREDEFSPLKNGPGAGVDCPETSRRDTLLQCRRFLEQAGVKIDSSAPDANATLAKVKNADGSDAVVALIELSPLVSFDGEGLEDLKGKAVKAPLYASSIEELKKSAF
jgi:UDP-N-acetylglucosamine/UDP-N-acetylgalactosamine diphosphorylase